MYGDCPPETTYTPPPPPAVVHDAAPPSAPQPVTIVTPAKVEQAPRRSLSSIWSPAGVSKPAGSTSRKSYPILGVPLLIVGMLVALISSINFVVGAFRVGLGWGLGCLFVAPVSFVYLVMHWKVAKRPFIINLAGLAAALIGYYVLGAGV